MSVVVDFSLEQMSRARVSLLTTFLDRYFEDRKEMLPHHRRLQESLRYSLLQEGSKRFRPVLAMLTAEALGHASERVLPLAAAVECIHTYSLIHDDLPAMDDDDMRRGKPTNHKVYGEATAILAGDALLTEAFQIIADQCSWEPAIAIRLVSEVARAAGLHGMVGGQAIDMGSKKESITLDELRIMHRMKTGALIRVSGVGAAIYCRASEEKLAQISVFADNLGLAFQVSDDLLDYDPEKPEPGSYPALLGVEKTREFLNELTNTCLAALRDWPASADPLRAIARYNRDREL